MAELTLGRVEPVRIPSDGARGGYRDPSRNLPRRTRKPARASLLAAAVPTADPEMCEVDYVLDADGVFAAIVVRDTRTHAEIARVPREKLGELAGSSGLCGLLYERRG